MKEWLMCSYSQMVDLSCEVAWCRGSIRDFGSRDPSSNLGVTTFLVIWSLLVFVIRYNKKAATGIEPVTFSLRERRTTTVLNRLYY